MRLVFVHGRDQQGKNPDILRRAWREALDVGLDKGRLSSVDKFEVAFPYYGDTLSDMVAQLRSEAPEDTLTKGSAGIDDRVNAVQDDVLRELLGIEHPESPDGEVTFKGWKNTKLALAAARYADDSRFGEALLRQFTEDVAIYLTNYTVGRVVDEIVREAIGTRPCVVVAHSLGSIVAYRVLRAMGVQANVVKFVTVGSPLGLNTIRKRLTPPALEHPAGVMSWVNAYDTRDIVSLRPLDMDNWAIQPPIANISGVDNHTDNRHGIGGYLDDTAVAKAIHEGLHALVE